MPPAPLKLILIMGVAGSGKSTVGRLLADELGWDYHEADDFHSAANKEKMAQGVPLNDVDRAPWLASIRAAMDASVATGRSAVFTCSALKEKYRQTLLNGLERATLIHLSGSRDLLLSRLQGRSGHYMRPAMLDSQLGDLELPENAISLDVSQPPAQLVADIKRRLSLSSG